MKYTAPIDTHVHLRDGDFLRWAFEDGRAVGLRAIIAQANTEPALKNKKNIDSYIQLIDKHRGDIECGVYVVMTPDQDQQDHAIALVEMHPRVLVLKEFYSPSTKSGKIEITDPQDQELSWRLKAQRNFKGVSSGHNEDKTTFKVPFDPKNPITHSLRQNPESEVIQVERQFKFAYDAGYEGIIDILHTSNPDTIDLVEKLNKQLNPKFRVIFETTGHHMFLNQDDYKIHGNDVKMNPPLRPKKMQERLLDYVLQGRTHIIGTDHAPHHLSSKRDPENPASGVPGIAGWPFIIDELRRYGMKEPHLEDNTFNNSNEYFFNGRLSKRIVEVEYNPSLCDKYGFNIFSRRDGTR